MENDFVPAIIKNNICFAFVNYTPSDYKLYVNGKPTGWLFHTLKDAKQFVELNWTNWL